MALNRIALIWLSFYAVILLGWAGLFAMVQSSDATAIAHFGFDRLSLDVLASLCVAAGEAQFGALFAMWALMSAAMMLPTFVPALRTYLDLGHVGASSAISSLTLVGGYLFVWLGASLIAAMLQLSLSQAGWLAANGQSIAPWLNAALLIGAGAYQFSAFKEACLAKCRMPMTFFMEKWRPGARPAWKMGLELGMICLGCCWALMLLGFVGGTMNLMWMGLATVFMTLEKLPQIGRVLTRPAGALLISLGVFSALSALG